MCLRYAHGHERPSRSVIASDRRERGNPVCLRLRRTVGLLQSLRSLAMTSVGDSLTNVKWGRDIAEEDASRNGTYAFKFLETLSQVLPIA